MRDADWTYANMQKALGNPSKKSISVVFKKYAPELANKDVNNNKIIKKSFITKEEGIFRYNCIKENKWVWNLQGDNYSFEIKNNILYFSESGYTMPFSELDIACRNQMLNEQQDQIKGNYQS